MAQRAVTEDGISLIIPGTYVSQRVISTAGGLGLAGVLAIVGEADQGPDWSEESDPTVLGFRPDQLSNVVAKFGSGRLVDAFRAAVSGNADPQIAGSVTQVYLLKTNVGAKAGLSIARAGLSSYADLQARLAGTPGNSLSYSVVTRQAEAAPAISAAGYYPSAAGDAVVTFRINGESEIPVTIADLPSAMPSLLVPELELALADEAIVAGGEARGVLPGGAPTLATTILSGNLVVTLSSGAWAANPSPGDIAIIRVGSQIGGGSGDNEGSYRVLSATNSSMTLVPVNAGSLDGSVTGAAQGATTTKAIECFSPFTLSVAKGQERDLWADVTGNVTLSIVSPKVIDLTLASGQLFAAKPKAGELLHLDGDPTGAGALFTVMTPGWYQIVSSENSLTGSVRLERLSNGIISGSPSTETAAAVAADTQWYKADIDGQGRSMEVIAGANAEDTLKVAASATASSDGLSQLDTLITAARERSVTVNISRPNTLSPITESWSAGGNVVLSIGYEGASCALTIDDQELSTVCSDSADDLSLSFDDYATVQALVDYINSLPRYSAAVVDQRFRGTSPKDLDNVAAAGAASSLNARPARIKRDAQDLINLIASSSQVNFSSIPLSGLPDATDASAFLSGGLKGYSTGARIVNAIDALELVPTNFVSTTFDRDQATDVAEGTVEDAPSPSDRYEIDGINAKLRSHVIAMSEVKSRKNRTAIASKKCATAQEARDASATLAHPRVALCWWESSDVNSNGQNVFFPCWYSAAKTEGMAAAAGYKGIVKKFTNITGFRYPSDFDPRKNGDLEQALEAGLLIVERVPTGGFRFVSDQTSYSVDSNFVYNSMQAVYVADLMTLTLIQNSDRVLVGQSVADISAGLIRGFLQSELANFLRLKFIAPSDDAPLGYKNLSVRLVGGTAYVNVEVKLAGLLYFVPIQLALSEVQQAA